MREDSEIPGVAMRGAEAPVDLGAVAAAMAGETAMIDPAGGRRDADPERDSKPDAAPDPAAREADLRLVEAILFAAAEPVTEVAIARRVGRDADVVGLLNDLAERYATRGVNVVKIGDKWTLRTAPDLAPRMKLEVQVARKLTRAAVETLAIIAYHQPVTRAEIEEIRGVMISPTTIENLMEAGWIKPGRRREGPGRPTTFVSTEQFLSHFGLERLDDLPGIAELRAAGLLDARPVSLSLGNREREEGAGTDTPSIEDAGDDSAEEREETPSAEQVEDLAKDAMEK